MPVNPHGLIYRAIHTHPTPSKRETLERRIELLGINLNVPPLSSVVAGITDGLGLTNTNRPPEQPAPQPAPVPSPQPSQPTQQPPSNPEPTSQPTTQPAPNQPPASSVGQSPRPSSVAGSAPSASASRPPSATGSVSPGVPQPGESGGSTPGNGGSDSDIPDGGDGGEITTRPGTNFVALPGNTNGTPIANAGEIPSQDGSSTTVIRGPEGTRTLVINRSTTAVLGGSPTGTDGPGETPSDAPGASKSSSSTAIIAAVSIIAALILLFLLFFLRRRFRERKTERRNQWWGARKRTSKDYHDDTTAAALASNRKSARSSFGTTFDRSTDAFDVNFTEGLPTLPPMAELRRTHNEFNSPLPTPSADSHRFSNTSIGSRSSRDNMSTFAFPLADTEGVKNVRLSGGSLSAGLHLSSDPFGDTRPRSSDGTVEGTEEGFYSCSSHTTDLHSDRSCVSSSVHGTFNEREIIRRPYTATMPDELTVIPGIQVKVTKVFDDGWAMVERLDTNCRGLIPLDCLREPGQDFTTFLQEKRVDTYVATANFN